MIRSCLALIALCLAACGATPTPAPPPVLPAVSPTPLPTLPVVIPSDPPLECGPEAAIALAQTQSDLAIAADSKVEAARQAAADPATVAQVGQQEYQLARELMNAYAVPDCLLQAKVFADQFFEERIDAYISLGANDQVSYESHLNDSEIARQNMITVVNGVLGQ